MTKGPENQFKDQITKHLTSAGHYYYVNMAGVAQKGLPDIIACINKRFVAIELKRPDNKKSFLTRQQKAHLQAITDNGGLAFVVADWDYYLEIYSKLILNPDSIENNTHQELLKTDEQVLNVCW